MSTKSILHSLLCLLFFTASLSLSARRLTPAEVPAAQDRAWQAWRAQVAADRSFYLPALSPLASAAPGEVQIPAQLEPDATMQFFYGSKGARPEAGYPLFLYLHGSGSPFEKSGVGQGLRVEQYTEMVGDDARRIERTEGIDECMPRRQRIGDVLPDVLGEARTEG